LESQYVSALAYTEYCGFKLDTERWLSNDQDHQAQEKEAEQEVVNWIFDNMPQYREAQLDLFSEDKTISPKITSTKDMTEVFKTLGVDTTVTFKGKPKDSIESKHLKKFKNEFPLIPIYLRYMEKRKLVTTYGESFLKHVNKGTGRLHSNYWQILNTGRISSSDPNLQNIPADENIRKCFIADEGNTLVVADYSAQETRVLADMANERNYIDFFKNGDGDSHSMVASRMFSEIEGRPIVVSKKENSDKRQIGKILSFQIAYGASAFSVKDSFGITEKEAQKFIDAYLDSFPDLKKYFEKRKKEVIAYGYVTTDRVSKRKIFMEGFDRFSELREEIQSIYDNGSVPDRAMTREYYTMKGKYERNALNYPIQSVSASMMKLAGVKVFNYILDNNLQGKVKMVSFIHDEMCLECPKEMAEDMATMVQDAMESAARAFCDHVEIPAVPNITEYWQK
jgi:DNA polymerase-1